MTLFQRSKKNDIDAFEQLVERHEKKVFNIILKKTRDKKLANCIAQEVFIRAFRKFISTTEDNFQLFEIYKITGQIIKEKSLAD